MTEYIKRRQIVKIIKTEVVHCEVCPFVTDDENFLTCHYPPNVSKEKTTVEQNQKGRPIKNRIIPIPLWCTQEDKE